MLRLPQSFKLLLRVVHIALPIINVNKIISILPPPNYFISKLFHYQRIKIRRSLPQATTCYHLLTFIPSLTKGQTSEVWDRLKRNALSAWSKFFLSLHNYLFVPHIIIYLSLKKDAFKPLRQADRSNLNPSLRYVVMRWCLSRDFCNVLGTNLQKCMHYFRNVCPFVACHDMSTAEQIFMKFDTAEFHH
jgi:hypothetical protein